MTNKYEIVAVTGLRREKLYWAKFNEQEELLINKLVIILEELVEKGATTFLTGMATGSDMIYAKAVLKLKNKYPHLILEAIIPFNGQDKYYNNYDKSLYKFILSKSDNIKVLSQRYSKDVYKVRNQYLVDNSTLIVAITDDIKKIKSGTTQTVNFAKKQSKNIIQLNPYLMSTITYLYC